MNILIQNEYGEEQIKWLKKGLMNGKITPAEYRNEVVLLARKGSIKITE